MWKIRSNRPRHRASADWLIGPLVFTLLFSALCIYPVAGQQLTPMPTVNYQPPTYPRCPAASICIVQQSEDATLIRQRYHKEHAPVWVDGENLSFFYEGAADEVRLCCGIQEALHQVRGSDIWLLTVHIPDLAYAIISYRFAAFKNGKPVGGVSFNTHTWRGPLASLPGRQVQHLQGTIKHYSLPSGALKETRDLTVYLPPGYQTGQTYPVIYMADGQSTEDMAYVLEPWLADRTLPPMLLVGVHSPQGQSTSVPIDLRAQEYLPNINTERFAAHEQFFTEMVRLWSEQTLGASTDRLQRAVFGFSNGAVFAIAMGLNHPDIYGHVLAFSAGMEPQLRIRTAFNADYYLLSGKLETGFHANTKHIAQSLKQMGISTVFQDQVSGHDYVMWREAFAQAAAWAFARKMLPIQF